MNNGKMRCFSEQMPVKVSVSMLVYNHEKYLRQAIESVLMQETDFRYEIVIGEDGSTDNSRKILLEYKKRYPDRFVLILHDENVGINENVNSKLHYLRGEYIAPLEGDDYWIDPEKLQKQVDFLSSHPDFTAVSHQIEVVNEDGQIISDAFLNGLYCGEGEFTINDLLQYHMPGQTGSLLFKNYLLTFNSERLEIFKNSPVMGDRKCTLINVLTGRVWCMSEKMSAYRQHRDSWDCVVRPGGTACYHYFESYKMEELSDKLLGIKLDFSEMRMHAWFGTVAYFIRNPNLQNIQAVIRTWIYGGKKVEKILFLLRYVAELPLKTIRLKNNTKK